MALLIGAFASLVLSARLVVSTSGVDQLSSVLGAIGVVGFLVVCTVGGYVDNWTWTGIGPLKEVSPGTQPGKTLWDLLQLLVVPVVLIGVGLLFTARQEDATNLTNEQQRQDALLNTYLDRMSDLMKQGLLTPTSQSSSWTQTAAQARTLATIRRLDGVRNGILAQFLRQSHLQAFLNLSKQDLDHADLSGADFSGVDLWGADLSRANLERTNLSHADLRRANLSYARMKGANLSSARLRRANLSNADLSQAKLTGAIWGHTRCPDDSDSSLVISPTFSTARGGTAREACVGSQLQP